LALAAVLDATWHLRTSGNGRAGLNPSINRRSERARDRSINRPSAIRVDYVPRLPLLVF
jgi:hypothetical protein